MTGLTTTEKALLQETAEEMLRASEEKFRLITEHMMDVVWQTTPDLVITYVTSSVKKLFGYAPLELVGKHLTYLLTPAAKELVLGRYPDIMRRLEEHKEFDGEVSVVEQIRKDGTTIWTEVVTAPAFDRAGQFVGFQGVTRDVSKRKEYEEALRASAEKYRSLVESISDVIFEIDLRGVVTYISPIVRNVFGYEAENLIGKTFLEFVHPEDSGLLIKRFSELTKGVEYPLEYRLVAKSGEVRHVRTYTKPIIKEKTFDGARGTLIDITDRHRAEEALRESEERFGNFLNASKDLVFIKDQNYRYLFVNKANQDFFELSEQEIIGKTDFELMPEKLAAECLKSDQRAVAKNDIIIDEERSAEKIFEIRKFPVRLAYKEIGVGGVIRDITARKRAEDSLRESEERFHGMFERHSAVMLLIEPVTGRILDANEAAEQFFGYTTAQLRSMSIQEINSLPPEEVEAQRNLAAKGQCNHFIFTHRLAKGDFRTVEVYSSPIKQNGVLILFSIIHDITDRKRMEEERLEMERKVLHAQKLESLGVMAGGIAHDFNNQLAVVLGNLELALTDETLNPDALHSIKSAVEAAKRSAELSRQMMIYSGGSLDFPVPVDIKELLNKKPGLLQLGVSKHVKLNLEINATLPRIKGDPDQIQRLVMNILVNASESIGDQEGDVTLRTGAMDCDEAYLGLSRLERKPDPGRFAFLEVTDTGLGMEPETQHRLFDPFFTTKFWGRGLGMAEVMGIVKG
ncbi:MAG: two-component system, cell cycle sensor histidine kinase and response regulator CckA, partial [Thermodesulfobacteriota bacterium]|nr:two-component system, cell cycle sensor histidine kinase and response regulator CckA [Thermodesulfobacteriota bacterium]